MILILHILIALTTISISIYAAFRPSGKVIRASVWGSLLTLASGVALVLLTSASLVHACISGCTVLGVSFALQMVAHRRLQFLASV